MSDDQNDTSPGSKLVSSVALTLIARGAIILSTAVGLPAAAFMLQRGVGSIDEVGRKVDSMKEQAMETGSNVRLIQQTQTLQTQIIADHETRVRTLESLNRAMRDLPTRTPN
jgi:hypothetical protein